MHASIDDTEISFFFATYSIASDLNNSKRKKVREKGEELYKWEREVQLRIRRTWNCYI